MTNLISGLFSRVISKGTEKQEGFYIEYRDMKKIGCHYARLAKSKNRRIEEE